MKLFKRLHKNKNDLEIKNVTYSEKELLKKYDFIGSYTKSTNEIYIAGYRDEYYIDNRKVKGEIILFENKKLIYRKTFERPNNVRVSDNGVIVFCDWLDSNGFNGAFIVLDLNGDIIFKKNVNANLGLCEISEDSSLAIFETLNSSNEDSNKIFIVDIIKKETITSFHKEFKFLKVRFDLDNSKITLLDDLSNKYIYDYHGNLINKEEIEEKLFKSSKFKEQVSYLHRLATEDFQEFIDDPKYLYYTNALSEKSSRLDIWLKSMLADIYRYVGEFFEKNKDLESTMKYYEEALKLNNKVGVKRKLDKMKSK